MSQDGNMRTKKQWMIYRYDDLSRLTRQLLATDTSTDQALRHKEFCDAFNSLNPPALYTGPSTTVQKYAYDHYGWFNDPALAFEHVDGLTRENGASLQDPEVRGYKTYEQLAVLTADDIQDYHDRAFYYDYKGRVIQTVEKDSRGNILRTTSRYDLIGNLLAQRESYTHGGTTDVLDRTFEYDSRSRMTKETAQFNDGEQAVVAYTYDDLGQLIGKTYGTGAHAIHETMDYNIQGWLTEKSSELFEMRLRYHDPESHLSDRASYTGNISSWWWKHRLINNDNDSENRLYAFTYDDLARLVDTELYLDDSYGASNEFVENGITYDKNSNIITLNRSSLSSDDVKNYLFSYSGNQRIKDETSNSDYEYDANGNIHRDALTGFYIYYNLLNLPTVIYTEGDMGLYYTYLSDGTKIEVCGYDDNEPTRYAGSLVYNDGTFESASFGGGRIVGTNNGANSEVHYFLTDHLGSTRVVAKVTPTGREDLDRKDYYPFGKEWAQPDMPTSDNRYTFSGKEKQHLRFQEIDYADFEARFYDADTGIFLQQDPMAESYYCIGQNVYCMGNPITFFDADGQKVYTTNLTKPAHKQAVQNMMQTKEGRRVLGRFMTKGESLSVGGTTFTAQQTGDRSKDNLSFMSVDLSKGTEGYTTMGTKDGKNLADQSFGLSDNVVDGVNIGVYLNNDITQEETATMAAGHEMLVHVDQRANKLNEIDKNIETGKYSSNPKQYTIDVNNIVSQKDHQLLGQGKIISYKKFTQEMTEMTKNLKYIDLYKEDVTGH